MRRALLLLAATGLLISPVPAQADPGTVAHVYAGTCALKVTFSFETPVGLDSAPDYSVNIAPLRPEAKPCVTTEHFRSVGRTTGVDASGDSSFWTCDSTLASGLWFQWFRDGDGAFSPSSIDGIHRVVGTWGAWTMEIEGWNPLNTLGAMQLTLDPEFADKATSACANGTLKTLRLIGVEVFEDPTISGP